MLIAIFVLTVAFFASSVLAYCNPPKPAATRVAPIVEDEDPPTEEVTPRA